MDAGTIVNIGLYAAYILLAIGLLGAIILPLIQAIGNPKSLVKIGLGLLLVAVVYGVSWSISGDEVTAVYENFGVNSNTSKIVGGGLIMTYLLMSVLVLGLVYSEISKLFK